MMKNKILSLILICSGVFFVFSASAENQKPAPQNQHQSFLQNLQVEDTTLLLGNESLVERLNKTKEDHSLIFIASWCGYCKVEMEYYFKKVKSGDCPRITFISIDDSESDMRAYLNKNPQLKTPVYLDKNKKLKKLFNLDQVPYVVYIGRDKKYVKTTSGVKRMHSNIDFMTADGEGRNGVCK